MIVFSVVVALLLTYGAPTVIHLFESGPSAKPAVLALQILVWTFPLASVGYIFSTALTAANDQVVLAWCLGIAVVFNLTLNAILIPIYSLIGACVATLATQMGVSVGMTVRYAVLYKWAKKSHKE